MNRQQLLSRIAQRFLVLYSTGTRYVWQRNEAEWKRAKYRGCFQSENEVWLDDPPKLLMRWPRFPHWDRLVVSMEAKRLRSFSEIKGRGPLIGYVFHPQFSDYLDALRPDFCVYHAYDLFRSTPGWNATYARRERQLLERADLVLASSQVIVDALLADGAKEVVVLPNGADVSSFSSAADSLAAPPADVAAIPRPRIGYTGNLNRKVDFPLIQSLASKHRDWHFVFVGAAGSFDEITAKAVEACRSLANVHFLGGKSPADLPAYVAAMDVNIMCYRQEGEVWTQGIYPLKLHEYLAAGRPVVTADIPSVHEFTEVLALARNAQEWEECLGNALFGNGVGTKEGRRAVAAENDWNVRAAALTAYLDRLILSGGYEGVPGRSGNRAGG